MAVFTSSILEQVLGVQVVFPIPHGPLGTRSVLQTKQIINVDKLVRAPFRRSKVGKVVVMSNSRVQRASQ